MNRDRRRTENFGLLLPEQEDFYDIEDFNENSRRIDEILGKLSGTELFDALWREIDRIRPKVLIATFTASGTFNIANHNLSIGDTVDVYIVGAGGGGSVSHGGGGGHCLLLRDVVLTQATFSIVVGAGGAPGANGGASSAFGVSMPGGNGSAGSPTVPGAGGSGGGRGSTANTGAPHNGGDGGTAGSNGSGVNGAWGSGNQGRTPVNPYDNIAYGSGGGGANGGRGGGAPGLGGGGNGGGLTGGGGHPGGGGGGGGIPSGSGGWGGNGLVYIYARPKIAVPFGAAALAKMAMTVELPGLENLEAMSAFAPLKSIKPLSEMDVAEFKTFCDELEANTIRVSILADGRCMGTAVFEDMATARRFFAEGVWEGADDVALLPDGYGIGDLCDGGEWMKQEAETLEVENAT